MLCSCTCVPVVAGSLVCTTETFSRLTHKWWGLHAAAGKLWCLQGLLARCTGNRDFKGTPSQILCLADALSFTQKAEAAIQQGTLPKLKVCCGVPTSLLHLNHRRRAGWMYSSTFSAGELVACTQALLSSWGNTSTDKLAMPQRYATQTGCPCCTLAFQPAPGL